MSDTTAPRGEGAALPPFVEPPPLLAASHLTPGAPAEPLVPWLSIWTRPRATLRQILDTDPRRFRFRLAALGGIAGALRFASAPGIGDTYPAGNVLAAAVAGGALGGILALIILAGLVSVAGRVLGGRGGMVEIMAALAWSYVPAIWGLLLWLPRLALLGQDALLARPSIIEGNPPVALFFGLLQLTQGIIGLWGFVITLKCIAEAHRFSSWRAFWTFVLVGLMIGIPAGILVVAARGL